MTYYYILEQKKEKETIFILLLKGMFNDQTECQKNKNCLLYCYYNYLLVRVLKANFNFVNLHKFMCEHVMSNVVHYTLASNRSKLCNQSTFL